MKTKIYALRDETRYLRYVGKTIKPLERRLKGHLDEAYRGAKNHRCNWIQFMRLHGFVPSITLIEIVEGNGNKEEKKWIKYFKVRGIKLVNGTDGGDGGTTFKGRFHTEETKRRMGVHHNPNSGMQGRNHSKITIERIRKGTVGKKRSDEGKRNISLAQKGRKCSAETKRKMSLAQVGRITSPETRRKLSLALKGRVGTRTGDTGWHHSIETRKKMSLARIGKPLPKQTRRRMSESGIHAWKKRHDS